MSPLWSTIKKMQLSINMRARTDLWFLDILLRVGDGVEETIEDTYIKIQNKMVIPYTGDSTTNESASTNALIDVVFPAFERNSHNSDYITSRAILSTKNENVNIINNKLFAYFPSEYKVYHSFDEAEDDKHNLYSLEFLNSLSVSGLPQHKLQLKKGCPIMLLQNIDPANGLCNGTRMVCRAFDDNVIDAEITVGQHAGKRAFLPRIPLTPSEDEQFPFTFKRKQFLVHLSFTMTINKS
ncbi:ATP-dependent DNA helicase PIF1-like protein [Tanacetum coccineum]